MTANNTPKPLFDGSSPMCIRGGRILDPSEDRDEVADLWIENGLIAAGLSGSDQKGDVAEIDASGLVVTPGLIDGRASLREPGFEYRETILSGTMAAGAGGYTDVICTPDTNPVSDNAEVIRYVADAARGATARIHIVGAATKSLDGGQLSDMGEMRDAGIVAVSDPTKSIRDTGLMRTVLEYAGMLSLPVVVRCEDKELAGAGLANEGYNATRLGLAGIPNIAEDIVVARDIMLAELTGTRIHITCVSTQGSVQLVRDAKARGIPVTCDVTPYHCILTDSVLEDYDPDFKLSPPLRSLEDTTAVQEGLRDGTIDIIVSDHAPYTVDEKTVEFAAAPPGSIGLESTLGLVLTDLVHQGIIDLQLAVRLLSTNPARVFSLQGGSLQTGKRADVTIMDPNAEWACSEKRYSKSSNSVAKGRQLTGRACYTILDGITYDWVV